MKRDKVDDPPVVRSSYTLGDDGGDIYGLEGALAGFNPFRLVDRIGDLKCQLGFLVVKV